MSVNDAKSMRGQVLRSARTSAALSARDLADRVNNRTQGPKVTDHAIYSYERGKVLLSADVAGRFSSVLGVPMSELLVGDPDYAPIGSLRDANAPMPVAQLSLDAQKIFRSGVISATADALLEHGQEIRDAVSALAGSLERVYGPDVRPEHFAASFTGILAEIGFVMRCAYVQRVRQNASEYQDLADLVVRLDKVQERVNRGWHDLTGSIAEPTRAMVVDVCRDIAKGIKEQVLAMDDVLGRCDEFSLRTRSTFTGEHYPKSRS